MITQRDIETLNSFDWLCRDDWSVKQEECSLSPEAMTAIRKAEGDQIGIGMQSDGSRSSNNYRSMKIVEIANVYLRRGNETVY